MLSNGYSQRSSSQRQPSCTMCTSPTKIQRSAIHIPHPEHSTLSQTETENPICQTQVEPGTMGQNSRLQTEATCSYSNAHRDRSSDLAKTNFQFNPEVSMRHAIIQQLHNQKPAGDSMHSTSPPKQVNQRASDNHQSSQYSSDMRPQSSNADTPAETAQACVGQNNGNRKLLFFLFERLAPDLAAEIKNVLPELSTIVPTVIEEPYYRDTQKFFLCLKCNWRIYPEGGRNHGNLLIHNFEHHPYTRSFSCIKQGSERLHCASCKMEFNRDVSFRLVESLIHHQRVFHTGLPCMSSGEDASQPSSHNGPQQKAQSVQSPGPSDLSFSAHSGHLHTMNEEIRQSNSNGMQRHGVQSTMMQMQHNKNGKRPQVSLPNNDMQMINSHIDRSHTLQTSTQYKESSQIHNHDEISSPTDKSTKIQAILADGLLWNAQHHQYFHNVTSQQVNTQHKRQKQTHSQDNWSERVAAQTLQSNTQTQMDVSLTRESYTNPQHSEIHLTQSVKKSIQHREQSSESIHNPTITEKTNYSIMAADESIPSTNIFPDKQRYVEIRQERQSYEYNAVSTSDKIPAFQNDDFIYNHCAKRNLQKQYPGSRATRDLTDKSSVQTILNALISDSLNITACPEPDFPQIMNCPVSQQKVADLIETKVPKHISLMSVPDTNTIDDRTSVLATDRLTLSEEKNKTKSTVIAHLHQSRKSDAPKELDLHIRPEIRTLRVQRSPTLITSGNEHLSQDTVRHTMQLDVSPTLRHLLTSEHEAMACTSKLSTKKLTNSRTEKSLAPQLKQELPRKKRRTVEYINLIDDEHELPHQISSAPVPDDTTETGATKIATIVTTYNAADVASFREYHPTAVSPASSSRALESPSPISISQSPGHRDSYENIWSNSAGDSNGNVDIPPKVHHTAESVEISCKVPGNVEDMSATPEELSPASTIGYENTAADITNNNAVGDSANKLRTMTTCNTSTESDMIDKKRTSVNALIARLSEITNEMLSSQQPLITVSEDEDECFIVE